MEMLIDRFYRCWFAKVDAYSAAHYCFPIEDSADLDCSIFVVKGDDYAAKGTQRRPCVNGCRLIYEVADY